MEKFHNLKEGQTGFYDGIECEVYESFPTELSISVHGFFGKHFYPIKTYKNKLLRFLGIGKWIIKETPHMKIISISYYNFKPKTK